MFLRVYRTPDQREILINVNSIWKIEVTYVIPSGKPKPADYCKASLDQGIRNPDAVRRYHVFAGSEEIRIIAKDPDDPVQRILGKLYDDSIKGTGEGEAPASSDL